MWKAQYSLSERLFWAFHISEGTVFKLSNLSFAYLHRFSHVISFCLYLYREAQRKITAGLYIGEGSENRLFRIFDAFPRPTGLKPGSQIWKGLFSDPCPMQKFLFLKVLSFCFFNYVSSKTHQFCKYVKVPYRGSFKFEILEAGRPPSAYQPGGSQT
jgi:hypothetical protein